MGRLSGQLLGSTPIVLDEIGPDLRPYLVPFLEWVDDDWTDCCFLSGPMVRAGHDPQGTKRIALEVLRYAFERGWVVAGHLTRQFERWPGSPADWLARLETEWPNDRVPDMGEVAWFTLADGAQPTVATLLEEEYDRRAA